MKSGSLAMAGLALAFSAASSARTEDSIKIGLLQSYSGISSLNGEQTDAAIKLFQKDNGDAPGGHKIVFVRRDTTGPNPEVAKRLVQEMVAREHAQILIGPDFTPNTLAAAPILKEAKVPSFVTGAATTGIIGEKSPYSSRTFFAVPQLCRPLAEYAVKQGWKKIFVAVADFAPGHDCEKYMVEAIGKAGGEVAGQLRIPLASPEYSGYLQRIRDTKPDALFIFMPIGEPSIGILRAVNDSGLKASIHVIGTGDLTDETYIDAVGDASIGVITTGIYSTTHDTPVNKKFVQDYVALNGASPRIGWGALSAYDAIHLVYDGLKAQSGAFDAEKFTAFVHGHSFESPRGPVTIDKGDGDITQNVYIRRTDKVGGKLVNTEIETFKDVPFQ